MNPKKPKKLVFDIPVSWTVTATVRVKATSLYDAKRQVKDGPLPKDGEYLSDSFKIDEDQDMPLFTVGDNVLASLAGGVKFLARVVSLKKDTDGTQLYTVTDQDDESFDCEASELTPDA